MPTDATPGAATIGVARLVPSGAFARLALVAAPVVALALGIGLGSDAALEREVGAAIARGDHAAARRLDESRTSAGAILVELRGDLACASSAPDEVRPALPHRPRGPPGVPRGSGSGGTRAALLRRDLGCGTRRSAAQLLGELRDRDALPTLEEARRSGGVLAFLCTGDSLDRAIAATRAAPE
jgi:hypothetical protein